MRLQARLLAVGVSVLATTVGGAALPAAGADEPAPAAPVADEEPGLGTWSTEQTGPGTWQVTWESPERLPLGGDRPTIVADDASLQVGVPSLDDDGRTVTAPVVSAAEPSPDDLDVVLSGDALDEPASRSIPLPAGRWAEPPRDVLPYDPGQDGSLPVVSTDYALPSVRLPGYDAPVEIVGHVVKPAPQAADPSHPLVLLLHGRHSYCYLPGKDRETYDWPCRGNQRPVPNHLGYDYLQRTLASQGFVTVSISANGINAQDYLDPDGGAQNRSRLVRAHLDQWARWAGSEHQVDLSRVVLVGHSRGGEGVARAALQIPLGAPYRVVGQVLLAPTAFARQTTPYVPTATVLPYCDGDVFDLQGQAYTDVSRDLADDDTSLKSSVLVMGANHNFFNTEWTPGLSAAPSFDDWAESGGFCGKGSPTRLRPWQQRRVGSAYVAGAARLFARAETELLPMYDGSPTRLRSTGDTVVLSHALGGGRESRGLSSATTLTVPDRATTRVCRGLTPAVVDPTQCGSVVRDSANTPHWPATRSGAPSPNAFEMSWREVGARGGFRFDAPLDVSDSSTLALRTVVDLTAGDVRLAVRVTDASGASVQISPRLETLPALPLSGYQGKYWGQTLQVSVGDLTGLDLTALSAVELVGVSGRGRVWVLDTAAAPEALAAVPAKRAALVDLGSARGPEGDDPSSVVTVPFTVTGEVTERASFRVTGVVEQTGRRLPPLTVTVDPGTESGVVRWPTAGDTRDDLPRVRYQLTAHALRNLMLRREQGGVVVVDDDPAPRVTVRRVSGRIREGQQAAWRVALSAPTDYPIAVRIHARRGTSRARPVTVGDIGRGWISTYTYDARARDPFYAVPLGYWGELRPGQRTHTVRIPIRRDGTREPAESLTLEVRTTKPLATTHTSTVRIAPSR